MKVQVIFTVSSKAVGTEETTFDLVISAADRVADVKERIASIQEVPFPDQDLVFQGAVVDDNKLVTECGIKEGVTVSFVVRATEATLVQQLAGLLQARPVEVEELALMYTHKYGVTAGEAMKMLGLSGSVEDLLSGQKRFSLAEGRVWLAPTTKSQTQAKTPEPEEPAPPPGIDVGHALKLRIAVKQPGGSSAWVDDDEDATEPAIVEIPARTEETVAGLREKAALGARLPGAFPELELTHNGKVLDGDLTIACCGLSETSHLELTAKASDRSLAVQLAEVLGDQGEIPISELNLVYSCKFGISADQVLGTLGQLRRRRRLADFLRERPRLFAVRGSSVGPAIEGPAAAPAVPLGDELISEHVRFLQLHERVGGRAFRVEVAQALAAVVSSLLQAAFLNIRHVVAGGAAGHDTAVEGAADAEVTIFVDGLPSAGPEKCLPGLLKSLARGIQEQGQPGFSVVGLQGGALLLRAEGLTSVEVRLSPAYETRAQALKAWGEEKSPEVRRLRRAALAEPRVRFVKRQPEPVKVTARLLKWWRDQHQWPSPVARPSDDLLDVLAVHAAEQLPNGEAYDQGAALRATVSVMAAFRDACVLLPTTCYRRQEVPAVVLSQRPLVLDPADPSTNLADGAFFDPTEMMAHAAAAPPWSLI